MCLQASGALLLFVLGLARPQQRPGVRGSVWDDPIRFSTKAGDLCTMHVTGQGELTTLRVSCRGRDHSYWCEFAGKPHVCRSYSSRPRHYFVQMMWGLRKQQSACRGGPRAVKPQMCRRASDEAQMVFSAPLPSATRLLRPPPPPTGATEAGQRTPRPAPRPGVRPGYAAGAETAARLRPPARRPWTPGPTAAAAAATTTTTAAANGRADKMSRDYCWRSLRGVCAFFIGWFY